MSLGGAHFFGPLGLLFGALFSLSGTLRLLASRLFVAMSTTASSLGSFL